MIIYYFGADEAWHEQSDNSIQRRNMAILSALSKDESVSALFNVIRCTRDQALKNKGAQVSKDSKIANLYIAPILPERRFLKVITRHLNRSLLRRMNPKAFERPKNTKIVSWCYWPKGFEDFQFMKLDSEMIFDSDHNIIGDPNLANHQKQKRKQVLLKAGQKAKLLLSSSRSMLQWYIDQGFNNTQLLMNGVNEDRIRIEHHQKATTSYQVTYCGTLSKWMKLDWLIQLAKDRTEWTINVIGKNYKTEIDSQLSIHKNIKMHGFLKPEEVDVILRQSDVCFGLYQELPSLDVNSMKLYDYLAQGIPVVVNNYHDHLKEDFDDFLNIADSYEEFVVLLENPKPIDMKRLANFLNSVTWNLRIKPVIEQLKTEALT